jgi:hypothetical protein
MRLSPTTLALGFALLSWSVTAQAATPGPECRSACAPRIAEQCAGKTGRDLRRCRRPLLRACRATTPEIACPSSADLTRALGDRQLQLSGDTTLLLCEDGRFLLRGLVNGTFPTPLPNPVDLFGSWSIVAGDGGLAIDLSANTPLPRRRDLPIARDAGGGFVVEGVPAADTDATAACGPPPPIVGDTPDDPADPERVLAVTRAITDRELLVDTTDASGQTVNQQLTLCSSGALRVATLSQTGTTAVAANDRGSWTIDETGASIELTLEDGLVPAVFGVSVLDDGRIFLNGQRATINDARGRCGDIDLETRFTALLPGNAYQAANAVGGATITTTLAFCDADRFALRSDIGSQRDGTWFVEATNGAVRVRMRIGAGSIATVASLAIADDGAVLVGGDRPTQNAEALAFACS